MAFRMSPSKKIDTRSLARLLTGVEQRDVAAIAQLTACYNQPCGAYCVGVTGPPGAGKSTLVDQLIVQLRARGETVAVIAIDPTSPLSGGAVLGDRIRMQRHSADAGVFIRSVGSRGAHGGLAQSTRDLMQIFGAHGFSWVIVETVGVGQSECDIVGLADTTIVVLVPEAGDSVQTLKAGLLEVADIFVVNKGDRAGADQMMHALMETASPGTGRRSPVTATAAHSSDTAVTGPRRPATGDAIDVSGDWRLTTGPWSPPVLKITATSGDGVSELMAQLDHHRAFLQQHPDKPQRTQLRRQAVLDLCAVQFLERLREKISQTPALSTMIDAVAHGEANPYDIATQLVAATR